MKSLLEYTGIEPGRLHFSWVSSAEASKFVEMANEVVEAVKEAGPARHLIKGRAQVA